MSDILKALAAIMMLAGIVGLLVIAPIIYVNYRSCVSYGLITQRPAQYDFWSDSCYVSTVNHGWIPKDEFTKREIGRE